MAVTVLHVYEPTCRPADQTETWEALAHLSGHGEWDLRHERTEGLYGYAEVLTKYWPVPGDIIVWEQDIVASCLEVDELVECPEPFCAFDYRLASGTLWSEVPGAVGWGLSKLTERARRAVKEDPPVPWHKYLGMPARLHPRVGPVHVHRPALRHNHVGG